jgi:hypothetical protein
MEELAAAAAARAPTVRHESSQPPLCGVQQLSVFSDSLCCVRGVCAHVFRVCVSCVSVNACRSLRERVDDCVCVRARVCECLFVCSRVCPD